MGLIGEGIEILNLVNKAQNAELYKELGEWIDKVGELQKQVEALTGERNDLREIVRFRGVYERINGHAFVQGDDEEICPRCAEVDSRPVHLARKHSKFGGLRAGCTQCPVELRHGSPYSRQTALREPGFPIG